MAPVDASRARCRPVIASLLTDDAITRGVAFLEAAAAVRAAGAEPVIAIPVVDRGGTAAAMCEQRRHRLHAARDRA